jgi:hypothetical protein
MGFGDLVTVLEPAALRSGMCTVAENTRRNYDRTENERDANKAVEPTTRPPARESGKSVS